MSPSGLVTRFMRLDGRQRMMAVEALAAVAAASAAVRFLPFQRAVRLGSRRLPDRARETSDDCCVAVWGVRAAAARVPWKALCFQQGLALQWMLRRRGIDARLHYGIGHGAERELLAHVWVSRDGHVLIGGEEASDVRMVAAFP